MRDAREARGAALAEVESVTRIRRRFLEAIESGEWGSLPEGPPSRGFIRIYARYLGMDADQCVTEFEAATGNIPFVKRDEHIPPPPTRERAPSKRLQQARAEAHEGPPPSRWKAALPPPEAAELDAMATTPAPAPVLTPARLPPSERVYRSMAEVEADESAGDEVAEAREGHTSRETMVSSFSLKKTPVITQVAPLTAAPRGPTTRLIGVIAAAAAVAGVVIIVGLVVVPGVSRLPAAAPTAATPRPVTASPAPPVPTTRPAALISPVLTPMAGATPASLRSPVSVGRFAPRAGGGMQFTLDARERAWVRVTADGTLVFEGIPPIGPGLAWTVTRTLTIETGNAGAFDAIVNSVRLGPLGARNLVVKNTYDASGVIRDE